ncbi:protein O-linked-mannose beta-1,2-N-acetylglucosaminyltransferase 1-like [Cryptotermes secundus]|uniref:protein O-linked-mannose beta-1,2-N-acetylglucosaminyltransferase 1-like n=1 Tax=Cryptotermes secundus TaxID=105785 RepID=UPI000CD7C037|nr:protein O-linked-mannose beta-1,2-N-acetylglucosaminyltransferase 1-like [Cryptotermes secundus]
MKQPIRDLLKRLGSKRAQIIGWRYMWAMLTQKGAKMFGESYSKSTEFNTWGAPVVLRTEIPLMPIEESGCDWADRREFFNHIEGYGSVCSSMDPAPLLFNPEPDWEQRDICGLV